LLLYEKSFNADWFFKLKRTHELLLICKFANTQLSLTIPRQRLKMSTIVRVHARQILDSRGNPTVEVDVITENGYLGRAAVPSGASTGEHEAVELRDGGKAFMGKGVLNAVENVNTVLASHIVGLNVFEQNSIDRIMIDLDGTPNKANLGANAILGVSLAVARAAAQELGLPLYRYIGGVSANTLPVPMMNIINGGSHSDAPIAFQEFMIIPVEAKDFTHAMQMGTDVVLQKEEEFNFIV